MNLYGWSLRIRNKKDGEQYYYYYYYYKDGSNGNIKVDSNGKGWRVMKQHNLRVLTLTVLGDIGGRLFLNRRSI